MCSFRLAIDRDRKGPNGERQTDFIDCVAWGRQAEFVAQWFAKGVMAIVVGRVQSRQWQDQNGNNRTAVEINCDEVSFGETKKAREANTGYAGGGYGGYDSGSQMRPEPAASQVPLHSICPRAIRIFRSWPMTTAMSHSNKEVRDNGRNQEGIYAPSGAD